MAVRTTKKAKKKVTGKTQKRPNPVRTSCDPETFKVGQVYLIRTVTFAWLGRVRLVTEKELVLDQASWVADTGRYSLAIQDGLDKQPQSEIEPAGDGVIVNRSAVVDAVPYSHTPAVGLK